MRDRRSLAVQGWRRLNCVLAVVLITSAFASLASARQVGRYAVVDSVQRSLAAEPTPYANPRLPWQGANLAPRHGGGMQHSPRAQSWRSQDFTESEALASVELPGADGSVMSIARAGGTLYLGGAFRSVGDNTGGFVALDGQDGRVLPTLPRVAGGVSAMVSDGAGGWFIGGTFWSVDGIPREHLAHILADGAVDASWHPTVAAAPDDDSPPIVSALVVSGSRLFVAGSFMLLDGEQHVGLGCLDAKSGHVLPFNLDLEFHPAGFPGFGFALASGDGLVFVGGLFLKVGGADRSSLAAIDVASGRVVDWRADVSGYVWALGYRRGALWAGGQFSYPLQASGESRELIAAIDVRSKQLLPFNARPGGIANPNPLGVQLHVLGFTFVGDTIYVAGNFTSIGGQPRTSIAALDAISGDALAWTAPEVGPRFDGLLPRTCASMAVIGQTLYVSGSFEALGGESRPFLTALRRDSGELLSWNPKPNGGVGLLVARGHDLVVGGGFSSVGDWRHRAGLAAIDLATGSLKAWNPNPNGAIITSVMPYRDRVFVSGDFTIVGGNPGPRHFLAALDTLNGELLPWDVRTDDVVEKMFIHQDALYLAGWFTSVGPEIRNGLASIDPLTGTVLPWTPTADGAVLATVLKDSTLYLGGLFTALDGAPRRGLGAIDMSTGATRPWNPDPDIPVVESLCDGGDRLFVGGAFSFLAGEDRRGIAAVGLVSGRVLPWHPETAPWNVVVPHVVGLAMVGDKLITGGDFSVMGGAPRICLAAVDTSTGLADDWNPATDGLVWSMMSADRDLYVGGGFTRAGLVPTAGLAVFRSTAQVAPAHAEIVLHPSLPNPAIGSTLLRFDLSTRSNATMVVYDLQGRVVSVPLVREDLEPGAHAIALDVRHWRSGVYFCRLETRGRSAVRKLLVTN